MSDTLCCTCTVFRPDATPRTPNYPPVCDGDRTLMDRHLVEIANLVADLSNPRPESAERRRYERFGRDDVGLPVSLGMDWAAPDPLQESGVAAPINSRSKQPSVSGSRERPIPIRVELVDLQAPARVPSLAPSPRGSDEPPIGWPEDQVGQWGAATVLDQWARDWRDLLFRDQHLPPATVDQLALWLRKRLPDACDHHPAIAEFAEEIRNLRGALRSAAGETEPQPERCDGVACKRCDMMMLYRQPDSDVHCVNPDCNAVYRDDEYQEWVKTLAAEAKIRRQVGQNA